MLNRIIARISKPMGFHMICPLLSCWGVAIQGYVSNTYITLPLVEVESALACEECGRETLNNR